MKRTQLRSKDVEAELQPYGVLLSKKDQVEVIKDDGRKLLLINHQPAFFYYKTKPIPTLRYLQNHILVKNVTIDMGAVPFLVKGADVMRPGIVEIEAGINKDDVVAIIDQNHKKPLAVGIALFNTAEMRSLASGKVIKNIHYVGDEIWRMEV